jgi:hypothetical protein
MTTRGNIVRDILEWEFEPGTFSGVRGRPRTAAVTAG